MSSIVDKIKSLLSRKKDHDEDYDDEDIDELLDDDSLEVDEGDSTGDVDVSDLTQTDLDEEYEEDDRNPIMQKVAKQLPFLTKFLNKKTKDDNINPTQSEDEEEDFLEDEEVKKKKFKLTPIHAVVVFGLLLVLLFDGEDTKESKEVVKKEKFVPVHKRKKNVKPKIVKEKKIKADRKAEIKKAEVTKEIKPIKQSKDIAKKTMAIAPVNDNTPVTDDSTSARAPKPVESDYIEPEKDPQKSPEQISKEQIKIAEEEKAKEKITKAAVNIAETSKKEVENKNDDSGIDTSEITDAAQKVISLEENKADSSEIMENTGSIGEAELKDQFGSSSADITQVNPEKDSTMAILKELEKKVGEQKKLRKKTLALEPIDAPNYESYGRALVYNCKGEHWACVDSIAFSICEKNYAWNSQKDLEIECYPSDLYANETDCGVIQQNKIDTANKPKQCN